MQFIDTHAHVYSEELLPDLNQLMQNAISSGVTKIFMPAIDSHSLEAMLSVENAFPKNCFSMAGLHPCYVKENVQAELDIVADQLSKENFLRLVRLVWIFIGIKLFHHNNIMHLIHKCNGR